MTFEYAISRRASLCAASYEQSKDHERIEHFF
jgi:hypothetical protein